MKQLKLYEWHGIDDQGKVCYGRQLSSDAQGVEQQLLIDGIVIFHLTRRHRYPLARDPQRQLILFFTQLDTMLSAGLTLVTTLELLAASQRTVYWQTVFTLLMQKISGGERLSQAMGHWPQIFPSLTVSLISAGEATGHLAQSCQQLAILLERQWKIKKKVMQTLRYPAFTLLLLAGITLGLILFILPEFSAMYHALGTPLPLFTQLLLTSTTQCIIYAPYLFIGGSVGFILLYHLDKKHTTWQVKRHHVFLHLPAIGRLWHYSQLSLFFSTFATTQHSGLTLLKGLVLIKHIFTSPLWKLALEQLSQQLLAGVTLSTALEQSRLFPPLAILLVRTAEQTGQLEQAFEQLATWYTQQAHELSQQLTSLLEPLLMVISGGLVGSIVIAIYLPILRLGEALG